MKKFIKKIPGVRRIRFYQNYLRYLKQKKKYEKNPVEMIKTVFEKNLGYKLNLENPLTFNEKLQWLKLYWYDRNAIICADKYEVRKYLEDKKMEHLLNELYYVYDSVEEVEWEKLPDKFVLKATHGSGMNLICKDKSKVKWNIEKVNFEYLMKFEYNVFGGEWVYKGIKPRIIIEKYLEDTKNGELIDYKILCFNGKAKCTFVCHDRNSSLGLKVDVYDLKWNLMPFERPTTPNSNKIMEKPIFLDEMIKHAEILAEPFPFVRVDFYEVEGKIYFGELTFFPAGGFKKFTPKKYDEILGGWLTLPAKQNN